MDKTQLITIAISALAGAVAKSLVDWLVSIIKTTNTVKTVAAKIRAAFSKRNRLVMGDVILLIFYASILASLVLNETPPTRLEILVMVGAAIAVLFTVFNLYWHVSEAIFHAKEKDL
jgi:hypothetical protein